MTGPRDRRPDDRRPGDPLPPGLDPRGRRHARGAARAGGPRAAGPRPADPYAGGPRPADGARAVRPHPSRPRRSALSRLSMVTRVVAAALSLVVLVGSGWAWATYNKFTGGIATGASLPAAAPGHDIDGKDQNILLIGSDSRAGATPAELQQLSTQNDGGSVNTDTMILLHVPADGSKATLISFPRDSYVAIPGHGKNRINAAYGYAYNDAKSAGKSETDAQGAGIALTARTISDLTGLTIDHYLQVDLLGFYRISVAIGGVDVCLNEPQNPQTDSDQFGSGYSGIDLPKGVSHIEGKQALAFVRQRHGLPRGDLDRIARQQYFLGAVFRKVSSAGVLLNPFRLNDLLTAVSSSLLKDPGLDLISLAGQVQALQSGNITFATMVTTGDQTVDGASVLGVDPDAVRAQVDQLLTVSSPTPTATVAPSTVSVLVQNGSSVNGAAGLNADRLRAAGFTVTGAVTADATSASTVVEYPEGKQAQAATLAAAVPGATLRRSSTVTGVTLLLGQDGLGVTDPAAATSAAAPPASAPAAPAAPAATPSTTTAATNGGLACIN